jgi:hypothetical protein
MRLILLGTALVLSAGPLGAQVGHPPAHSPYRDIAHGRSVTVLLGDFGGDGGTIGVGPHHGTSYGLRFDLRLSAPVQFGFSLARARLERFVVSAADSVATRTKGPVDQNLTMIEAALQLNLTGRKSWHRLAPFLSGSLGFTHGSDLPASAPKDSSGYSFGSRFYLVPAVGVRVMVSNALSLRLEARQVFWKLSYPVSYTQEPAAQPSTDPNKSNAVLPANKRNEWTGGRELRLGLGFAF